MNFRANATFSPVSISTIMDRLIPPATEANTESVALVKQTAQTLAPVHTGELREGIQGSVQWDRDEVRGEVVSTAPHSQFVEYGTGLTGSGTYPGELPKEGVPITGQWIYDYKNQGWKGMASQPYMLPALWANRENILAIYRRKFGR